MSDKPQREQQRKEQQLPEGVTYNEESKKYFDADGVELSKSKVKALIKQASINAKKAAKPPQQKPQKDDQNQEKLGEKEELTDAQFYERRLAQVTAQLNKYRAGEPGVISPYPHYFPTDHTIPQFRKEYEHLQNGEEFIEIRKVRND